ncbi:MAG: sodium:proton antiporter, partial [Candidatus Aminicenantes bacterium]|nr:sodium:proton antiporter [Candidatus Aminicenantes bacterium]
MIRNEDDIIIRLIARVVSPFIMLFALYVIFHGHYSPGGGFQGGTMLAAAVILIRLAAGSDLAQLQFRRAWAMPLGLVGVLIFWGTGFAAMLFGGNFLDYAALPLTGEAAWNRHFGILFIEIGVG